MYRCNHFDVFPTSLIILTCVGECKNRNIFIFNRYSVNNPISNSSKCDDGSWTVSNALDSYTGNRFVFLSNLSLIVHIVISK